MDLHIHTCLSPCGDPKSVPTRIVNEAKRKKLDVIAICDHNASENVSAVRKASEGSGLTVFGGMEITTQEEIHILGIFDDAAALTCMQQDVYDHLEGNNDPRIFGDQFIVDYEDFIAGYNDHLLIGATDIDLETIVSRIHELGGAAIASHIDREAFGIISQLGFVPEDIELDALELSRNYRNSPYSVEELVKGLPFPSVMFSDAHFPADIGSAATTFLMEGPTVAELREALAGENGRHIVSEAASA